MLLTSNTAGSGSIVSMYPGETVNRFCEISDSPGFSW
jgi:hypothetical protein